VLSYAPDRQFMIGEVLRQRAQHALLPFGACGEDCQFFEVPKLADEAKILWRQPLAQTRHDLVYALFKVCLI
jgi:hypothetical protein